MSLGLGPIGQAYTAAGLAQRDLQREPAGTVPTGRFKGVDRVELSAGSPPPELHVEVEAAYQRALDLAAQNRELHFSRDEHTGRIVVQVRDLDGNVIRDIPGRHALAVMAGEALD